MSKVISLHIGQGGIQLGSSVWKMFCSDLSIERDGVKRQSLEEKENQYKYDHKDCLFKRQSNGNFGPRALFLDFDSAAIDSLKTGSFRHIFNSTGEMNVPSSDSTGGNFARGYYSAKNNVIEEIMNSIKTQTEDCAFQGFMIYHSVCGGVGSGVTARVLERLSTDYPKKSSIGMSIFPYTNKNGGVLDTYNMALFLNSIYSNDNLCVDFMYGNDSLDRICREKLKINKPKFSDMNEVISLSISSLTRPFRFDCSLPLTDLIGTYTGLVPYPTMKYAASSISPLRQNHGKDFYQVTCDLFDESSFLFEADPLKGEFLSCNLHYHGLNTDKPSYYVDQPLRCVRNQRIGNEPRIKFVEWSPSGFRVGLDCKPLVPIFEKETWKRPHDEEEECYHDQQKASIGLYSIHSSIRHFFIKRLKDFDLMFKKKAYLHWYMGEGMEFKQFEDARESLQNIINDYTNIYSTSDDEEEGEGDDDDEKENDDNQDEFEDMKNVDDEQHAK